MKEITDYTLSEFLESCKVSSQQTYENLKNILGWLENEQTQKQARIILAELEDYFCTHSDQIEMYHFSIDKMFIQQDHFSQESHLTILQLPSIFTPEDWSFTFYEGLMRCPEEEFHQRILAELGCGNGWISIALALKCQPMMIYGLDINPKAIVCAKINLYLNGLNKLGHIKRDSNGKSLLDKVQFHVSDLLGFCLEKKIYLDKVIGCIPQVLSPNSNFMDKIIPENATDEALYALSNYCSMQGYVEDQFGLGLIARAVEESIQILKSNGKLILNLGGRPGQAVLNRLFTRRGLLPRLIWQTKIEQASDTDILPLVEIENHSSHRFEFFLSSHSKESISARTAYALTNSGGTIFHSLNVIEAELKDGLKMRNILELMNTPDFENVRSALDLTYTDPLLISEKISFLSRLCEKLKVNDCFPYEGLKGTSSFRRRIAEFCRIYWRAPLTAKNILVAPNRIEIIKNYLTVFQFKRALVDCELSKQLNSEYLNEDPVTSNEKVIIEIPKHSQSICELIERIRPDIVVCSLRQNEMQNLDSFIRIIDTTKKTKSHLLFDFSDSFELSSFQKSNGLIEYLSQKRLPSHVSLICGLIYNRIYQDMDIAFMISENMKTLEYLANAAELTYSRPSFVIQEYYDTILYNLLNFHMKNQNREKNIFQNFAELELESHGFDLELNENAKIAFLDPALESTNVVLNKDSVRLDYGENCLPTPNVLKSILLESLVRQNISDLEMNAEDQISKYLTEKYLYNFKFDKIVLGNGIAPLFASIAKYCANNNITIIFPTGAYGYFVACAKLFGAKIVRLKTQEIDGFKYNSSSLEKFFKDHMGEKFFLFFNAPVVNPMGNVYSSEEMHQIINICLQYQVTAIMDTIFSGLEFSNRTSSSFAIKNHEYLIILGGISKQYAAAGLRLGYIYVENHEIFSFIQRDNQQQISKSLRYTAKKLFQMASEQKNSLNVHNKNQNVILENRSRILADVLRESGWEPYPSLAGLFLIAKPTFLAGKKVQIPESGEEIEITYDNVDEIIFKVTGLLINGSRWCGLTNYCRFVLSVTENEFIMACERIRKFFKLTL